MLRQPHRHPLCLPVGELHLNLLELVDADDEGLLPVVPETPNHDTLLGLAPVNLCLTESGVPDLTGLRQNPLRQIMYRRGRGIGGGGAGRADLGLCFPASVRMLPVSLMSLSRMLVRVGSRSSLTSPSVSSFSDSVGL